MKNVAPLMDKASGLWRKGRLREAAEIYGQILAKHPGQPDTLYQASILARQGGDLARALAYADRLISVSPGKAESYFLRALIQEDMHQLDGAMDSLRNAIRIRPEYAEAHNNLGIILRSRDQFQEAIDCFRKAIQAKPDYARAFNNLGLALKATGDIEGARQQFEQAIRLKPDYSIAYSNLGDVQRLSGMLDEAEKNLVRAVQLRPGNNSEELINLARLLVEKGNDEQARMIYHRAATLAPHALEPAIGYFLSLPYLYKDREELVMVRERYANGLKLLQERMPDFIANNSREKLLGNLVRSNFFLAYQGKDDLKLQVEYSHFVSGILQKVAPELMQTLPRKPITGRKVRIGFMSGRFRSCTAGLYFRSWITWLDRSKFEIFVYYTSKPVDPVTLEISSACDHFHHLANMASQPASLAGQVLNDDLDILVYPELGMDAEVFLLAAMRLAPVQCAGWGHPVSSGHANMDYFFSSAEMEPEQAADHYSESLVLLDGIGTCYSMPEGASAKSRSDFSLPEGRTLYLCPQSLFKIHPDNDELFTRILARDPNGILVIFSDPQPDKTNALANRLARSMQMAGIDPGSRLVVLPKVLHDDFLCVNKLCDVMLDTLHWSGGNTSLDAIACGLPIVTLPGEYMRGRQSYGMLKMMGLEELIATDQDDYVEKAVRLGTDKAWRAELSQRIQANRGKLFGQETALKQLEQFYLSTCSQQG